MQRRAQEEQIAQVVRADEEDAPGGVAAGCARAPAHIMRGRAREPSTQPRRQGRSSTRNRRRWVRGRHGGIVRYYRRFLPPSTSFLHPPLTLSHSPALTLPPPPHPPTRPCFSAAHHHLGSFANSLGKTRWGRTDTNRILLSVFFKDQAFTASHKPLPVPSPHSTSYSTRPLSSPPPCRTPPPAVAHSQSTRC